MAIEHTIGAPVEDKDGSIRVPYTHHVTGETGELVFFSREHLLQTVEDVRRCRVVAGTMAEARTLQALERWSRLDAEMADVSLAVGLRVDSLGDVLAVDGERVA